MKKAGLPLGIILILLIAGVTGRTNNEQVITNWRNVGPGRVEQCQSLVSMV